MKLDKEAMKKVAKMNESFNKSLSDLNRLLDGDKGQDSPKVEDLLKSFEDGKLTKEDLEKALKGGSKGSMGSAGSDSEEVESPIKGKGSASESESEEAEPPMKGSVRKSLEAAMYEDDDIAQAVDVEPFLKALMLAVGDIADKVEAISGTLSKSIKKINKKVAMVETLSKAHAKATCDALELQKSISDTVEKIGGQPITSTSMLRKGGDRFGADQPSLAGVQKDRILNEAIELRKSGKLEMLDVTLIEGRLNAGQPLEPKHAALLAKSISGKSE